MKKITNDNLFKIINLMMTLLISLAILFKKPFLKATLFVALILYIIYVLVCAIIYIKNRKHK